MIRCIFCFKDFEVYKLSHIVIYDNNKTEVDIPMVKNNLFKFFKIHLDMKYMNT